jgi:hypothetical protein
MIALALLLASAPETIALRLEDAGGVSRFDARSLLEALAERIESKRGARVVIDDLEMRCPAEDRCRAEILERTKASEIVWLKMVKGPRRIHLEAWRGATIAEANVTKDQADVKARLDEVTSTLFPEAPLVPIEPPVLVADPPPTAPPIVIAPVTPPPPEVEIPVLPVVLAGAALVSAGVGLGFGLSSQSAGEELGRGPILAADYQTLRDRETSHATISNVGWIGAAGLLTAAALSWLLGAP